jgi:hypothetical protein
MDKKVFGSLAVLFMVLLSFQLAEAVIAAPPQPQVPQSQGSMIINQGHTKITWNIQVANRNNVRIVKTISVMRNHMWRPETRVTIALVKTTPRILRKTVTTTNLRTHITRKTTTRIVTRSTALQYLINNFRMLIRDP